MSNKYEVNNGIGMNLGLVTKYRAEKAIFYGIANRGNNINHKSIYTNFGSMVEFEHWYKLKHKENNKVKTNCWECGKEMNISSKSKRPYCNACEIKRRDENEIDTEKYSRLRSRFMLERAFKILEKQQKFIHIDRYKESGEIIENYIQDNYTKFDSAHEMVASMELLKNRIHIKIQPIINGRKADFMLKEEKVILEIDGFLHEHSQEVDYKFDLEIREELGADWEVIRIPTNYIESNVTMLYEAIMELKIYKQKLREQNNGILPDYYSIREEKALMKMLK